MLENGRCRAKKRVRRAKTASVESVLSRKRPVLPTRPFG
ncbi:hypothetical protein PAMC26577_29860 [Caballeronia sordidicola]|uniref:Uncharacterized protein n=1 Tax=Caballeronia sordidicola TaxID=196367 RepID=A0A242MF53_CABSO|nr:hypothetical protein PAMC26577_29860 [Caballeronia sordidicola]